MLYQAYFDGSNDIKKQQSKVGGFILSPNNEIVFKFSHKINHEKGSHRVEYESLLWTLRYANRLGIKAIKICGDCKSIIDHVNNNAKINNCIKKRNKFDKLSNKMDVCIVEWIPRKKNHIANYMSRRNSKIEKVFKIELQK
ncbi:MAG: reverse transcriptase-like protein [Methanofastidiosum sp.]